MAIERPDLSIITVAYNDLDGVIATCESLRALKGADRFEHLVIDGGSVDGTAAWYESNRPLARSILLSEPDDGIYDAMNKGLRLSTGRFVTFMNAGDRYASPLAAIRAVEAMESSDGSWGYGRARVVGPGDRDVRPPVGRNPYSRMRHLYGRAQICHQAVLMSRQSLVDLGGFSQSFGLAGDYHLLVRAAGLCRPVVWDEIDVLYQAGGLSERHVYAQLRDRHRARVDALRLGAVPAALDAGWTSIQGVNVRSRKFLKRLLHRTFSPPDKPRAVH